MSLNIGLHFCEGHLKSIALFGKAKPCHSTHANNEHPPGCPFASDNQEDDCCSDTELNLEKIDTEVELYKQLVLSPDFDLEPLHPTNSSSGTSIELHHQVSFRNYKPPLPAKHDIIWLQTFLI